VAVIGVCFNPLSLVMEFMPGGSLQNFLKDSEKLEQSRKLKFALDCAKGVKHLHDRSIVHRDIAARNVLLGADGTAKISDCKFLQSFKEY
jgi:serine/threonine protein kinase